MSKNTKKSVFDFDNDLADFLPLTREHLRTIERYNIWNDQYDTVLPMFGINVGLCDIQNLIGNIHQFPPLNNTIIDAYMQLIVQRSLNHRHLPRVFTLPANFFKKMLIDKFDGVKTLTKYVDIFSFDIVLIPIGKQSHRCLVTIDFKDKCINYYDSKAGDGTLEDEVLSIVVDYIRKEHLDKLQVPFNEVGWAKRILPNIPQQRSPNDSGVFICMFAEFLCRRRPITFSKFDVLYFRIKMVHEIGKGELMVL